mgnify:FL=1
MSALKTRSRITDPAGGWGWVGFGMLASVVTAAFAWVVPQPAVTVVDYLLAALFLVPCAGLLFAWWRIGPRFPHPVVATVLWALPLLACPLLFSFDVNAYLTQGWMVLGGHDPYVMTLGEPRLPGITVGADWVDTTSVYPAGALLIFAAVFWASGGLPWLGILLFRLLHLACLLVVAWAVKRVAPRVGVPVNTALWAGIATPLLILQWIGGLHNDAVLVALIALAVLVATRGGWSGLLLGGALIGLSLTVKQSGAAAGLGIVALAWAASPGRDWWRLAGRAAAAGAVAVGVFVGVSLGSGLGFGWNNPTAGSPLAVMSDSPLSWVIQVMRFLGQEASLTPVMRVLTLVAGLAVLTAWVWLVARFGPRPGEPGRPWVVLLGGLLAFALLGPALQPWYFTWVAPFVALALPGRRWQRIWLSATVVVVMAASTQVSLGSPLLGLAVWWLWRRLEAEDLDVLDERTGV